MTQARDDPLTGRTVILAPGRAVRPDTLGRTAVPPEVAAPDPGDCPFCPGNEHLTPAEIARTGPGDPGTPGWRTRVFPNRYPIVGGPRARPVAGEADDLRPERAVGGAHEVVVLSPDHARSLARLELTHVVELLAVLRDRARAHADAGRRYTQVIVNHGAEGGASLAHPHAQVISVDLEPPAVRDELVRITTPAGCLVCREISHHAHDPDLVVAIAPEAELWCPWASGTAYEMMVAPRRHRARFEDADEELAAIARLLREGLARLDRVAPGAPYNLAVHSRPAGVVEDYHWHVHLWPRLQREAGFERGSGLLVEVVEPERAAAELRHP